MAEKVSPDSTMFFNGNPVPPKEEACKQHQVINCKDPNCINPG